MKRIVSQPRANLQERFETFKFDFGVVDGLPYWDESAYYAFSLEQVEQIEAATAEIWGLSCDLLHEVCEKQELMEKLKIPAHGMDVIADSYKKQHNHLYGRMDFSFAHNRTPKLLEFNADTPTSLYESAVFQWVWLEDMIAAKKLQGADQFNSIHEKLVAQFNRIMPDKNSGLHFVYMKDAPEDYTQIVYMEDCAKQANIPTRTLIMDDIGVQSVEQGPLGFVDQEGDPMRYVFKLYPWEWMFADNQDTYSLKQTTWFEPPWKAVMSNKAFLALLWERYPRHPNLLETYIVEDAPAANVMMSDWCRKPIYSREGANVRLVQNNSQIAETEGEYGKEGFIIQELSLLPNFDGKYPLVGSWLIGNDPAGMSIRESDTLITNNTSRFVPHIIQA